MAKSTLWWIAVLACAVHSTALTDATDSQTREDIYFDETDDGSAASLVHDDAVVPSESEDTGVTDQFGRQEMDETVHEQSKPESAVVSEVQESVQVVQPKPVMPSHDVSREEQMLPPKSMVLIRAPTEESKPPTAGSSKGKSATSSLAAVHQGLSKNSDQSKPNNWNTQVLEEYDDAAAEGDSVAGPADDEKMTVKDNEPRTSEDIKRLATGDVDPVEKPLPKKRAVLARLPRISKPVAKVPQSLVRQGARLKVATKRESPQDRMKSQCNAFGSFLGTQMVAGPEMIRIWKGTCDGPVKEGVASPQYVLMCNALGSAVEEEAVKPAPNMGEICTKILRVFNEAGIGKFF